MSPRIPPLLEPYLVLPSEASLILLTSVLGASSNWLVLRFLHSALIGSDLTSEDVIAPEDEPKVLLVSFLRDLAFWKDNARRLGLDLDKLGIKKKFAFVDGLSGIFLPQNVTSTSKVGEKILISQSLDNIYSEIKYAIRGLKDSEGSGKVLIVIDQLDFLLAAGGEQAGVVEIGNMLLGLRENAYATIICISADHPLSAGHQTPLESDHAGFLLSTAHQADLIMSLRLLDTGTAKDVSGVLRITIGDGTEQNIQKRTEDRELLYFVGGDGGVKVFERGQ
ncbi:hypothetical protein BUE80_DR005135 [Diplocarpon rosae]|nr:hypothetical protein BUE80_DR005135 [Diplocarpon rosae]